MASHITEVTTVDTVNMESIIHHHIDLRRT
jgi:hypothetical protein